MRTTWGDHDRFIDTYFTMYKNLYFTGDGCRVDQDGDYWLMGRVDDVVNVSGHRIGTAEVESALVSHRESGRSGRRADAARNQGPGPVRVCHAEGRRRAERRTEEGTRRCMCARKSGRLPRRTKFNLRPACRKRVPAKSCAASCARSPRTRRGPDRRHHHAGRSAAKWWRRWCRGNSPQSPEQPSQVDSGFWICGVGFMARCHAHIYPFGQFSNPRLGRLLAHDNGRQAREFISDDFRVQRRARQRIQHNAPQASLPLLCSRFRLPPADRQTGIIGQNSVHSHENGIAALPQFHPIGASFFASNPFRLAAGGGNFSVQGHRRFHRHQRKAMNNPVIKSFIQPRTILRQDTGQHSDSHPPQNFKTVTRVFRIWVGSANDDSFNSRRFNGTSARRRAPLRATRLQRHVKRRRARIVSALFGVPKRFNFRVRQSRALMPAASDNLTAANQNSAHHRVGRRRAKATPCQP
jgi:hypothetical protein